LKSDCDSTLHPAEYDFAKGGKLLAKAGWTDKNQNGLLDCREGNGTFTEFEPELLYLNASPDWQSIAELITASAAKVGIRIKAVAVDPVTFSTRAKNHDFDILLGSWGGNALPEDPTQLWGTESWNSNGSNYSGFGNSRTDSLIATVVQSPTDNQRRSASIELQKSIQDEQPYVFLYNAMRRMIIHKRWTDVLVFPDRPGYLPDTLRLRCQ
ncbi:MAG: ABC transporter substrate-binding protein, partial [Flavobacteriales bacterium]